MDTSTVAKNTVAFDPQTFRREFPPLEHMVHLASCSQGALSAQLSFSMLEMLNSIRDDAAPWGLWMGEVEKLRRRFAKFINADVDEIAIVSSASEGAYQVASSFNWASRPGVATSALEFPSVGHVWRAQSAQGAQVRSIDDRHQALDAAAWEGLIDDSVSVVSTPLVSYHDGAMAPLKEITALAHQAGARMFVDAYQGTGVVPVDVKQMDCDYLVTGSLKYMLGLAGIAFLYVKDGVDSQRNPELTGWFGRINPFEFEPGNVDYPAGARRFEVGTPSVPAVYAANAGIGLLETVDRGAAYEHLTRLRDRLADGLVDSGVRVSRPSAREAQGPQVAVYDADPVKLAEWLHSRGIMTAPRGELVRMSLHYYNTDADVDRVLNAMREYRRENDK